MMPDPGLEPGAHALRVRHPAIGRIRRIRQTGFEPAVYGLKARCHPSWLLTENILFSRLVFSHNFTPCYVFSGSDGARTHTLLLAKQILSQLSYQPILLLY